VATSSNSITYLNITAGVCVCVCVLESVCGKDKREQDWYKQTTWGTSNLHFHKHGNGMIISRILEPL
jgi:hypothetical protein